MGPEANGGGCPGGRDGAAELSVRIAAATSIRRLAHAVVGRQVDASALRRIAELVASLADEVERRDRRDRGREFWVDRRFAALDGAPPAARPSAEGARVDLFTDSPVSGTVNPLSMGLQVRRDGDHAIGSVSLEAGWEGAPGRSHGGVVAACVDETIGGLLPILGMIAFTGRLTLHYRAPCPMGVPLEFRAWLEREEGRKLFIRAVGSGPDGVFVEADAVFISVDLARLAGAAEPPTDADVPRGS